jgi:hypothetical protein
MKKATSCKEALTTKVKEIFMGSHVASTILRARFRGGRDEQTK